MAKMFFLPRRSNILRILIFIETTQMVFAQSIPSHHYVIPAVIFSVFAFIALLVFIYRCVRATNRNQQTLSRQKQIAMQERQNRANDLHDRALSRQHLPRFQRSDFINYQSPNLNANKDFNPYFQGATGKNLKEVEENKEVFYENCSVCLEKECNVILSCQHAFHLKCIADWFHRNKDCPNCRRPIDQTEMKRYQI